MASFNLIDQAWIPVIMDDNSNCKLSLIELFEKAHKIREIYCDYPLETISLYRFLQALLIRIYEVNKENNWLEIWHSSKFDVNCAKDYFSKWHNRFDIFDKERPFYQFKLTNINEYKTSPYARLIFEAVVKTQRTLFNHSFDSKIYEIKISDIPIKLITAQGFLIGAGAGYTDTNLSEGINIWIRHKNLFYSLLLNSPPLGNKFYGNIKDNSCTWEKNSIKIEKHRPTIDYLDYLTWQSRSIYFKFKDPHQVIDPYSTISTDLIDIFFLPGEKVEPKFFDPLMPMVKIKTKEKNKYILVPKLFNKNKAFWRDANLIYEKFSENGGTARNLEFLATNSFNIFNNIQNVNIELYGVCKGSEQGAKELLKKETMPFYPKLLNSESNSQIRLFLENAEKQRLILKFALEALGRYILYASKEESISLSEGEKSDIERFTKSLNIINNYWFNIEPLFLKFIKELADTNFETIEEYEKFRQDIFMQMYSIADTAFTNSTQNFNSTAKHLKAITLAKQKLHPINYNGEKNEQRN